MPNRDGTGPDGNGAGTGRGAGQCFITPKGETAKKAVQSKVAEEKEKASEDDDKYP